MSRKSSIGSQKGWTMAFLLSLALGLLLAFRKKSPTQAVTQGSIDFFFALNQVWNEQTTYGTVCRDNWALVSKMETAVWTSSLFKNANNPWGMTFPTKRDTTAIGVYVGSANSTTSLKFARYEDLFDGCKDIIDYMDYWEFPKGNLSLRAHIEAMGELGYFGEESVDSYYNKVVAWQNR